MENFSFSAVVRSPTTTQNGIKCFRICGWFQFPPIGNSTLKAGCFWSGSQIHVITDLGVTSEFARLGAHETFAVSRTPTKPTHCKAPERLPCPSCFLNHCNVVGQSPQLKGPIGRSGSCERGPWPRQVCKFDGAATKLGGRIGILNRSVLGRSTRPSLFVASMVAERKDITIHAFAALMARSEQEFRYWLTRKAGYEIARTATIRAGFDPSEPIAISLLSDSIAEILLDVRDNPTSILAAGLDVFVEHRFA